MTRHDDGIYFGLDAVEYHADPAIGSTGMKDLIVSPVEWWWGTSRNPLYEEPEASDAMTLGSAIHSLVLEGRDHFERHFARELEKSNFPTALVTVEDLKRFIDRKGRRPQASKPDLIKQALEHEDCPPIWSQVEQRFELENAGKSILPAKLYEKALLSAQMITANPELAPAFREGMAEVSVFWTVDGVRLKARIDYLKIISTIDLKSFAVKSAGRSIDAVLHNAIGAERYDVQAVHYGNARMQFPRLCREGRVFGDHDPAWLKRVAATQDWLWVWIFYKTTRAPIARGKGFDMRSKNWENAQLEITKALEDFRKCEARFGDGVWIDETPIDIIGEGDLPSWLGR